MAKKKKEIDMDAILKEITGDGKDFNVEVMGSDHTDMAPYRIDFRNLALQKITDGLAGGRMAEISGDSGSGKSFLLYELMAHTIAMGGIVLLNDVENAFEPAFMRRVGLEKGKNFFYTRISDIEKSFAIKRRLINSVRKRDKNIPILVADDSFAGLMHPNHIKNLAEEKGQPGFAFKQKNGLFNFHLFNFCTDYLGTSGATYVLINQTRKDHSVMFGDGTYTLGEKGIQFWCDLRVQLKVLKKMYKEVPTTTKKEDKKVQCGVYSKVTTIKARGVESHKTITLGIDFSTGMSKYSGLTELLVNEGRATLGEGVKKYVSKGGRNLSKKVKTLISTDTGEEHMKVSTFVEAEPECLAPPKIDFSTGDYEELDTNELENA